MKKIGDNHDIAALGPTVEIPHHPLACDPEGDGFLNWIDRITFGVTDRLNPILIKEARESLKSRQFLVTFCLLLVATLVWTVLGIVFNAPEVYYLPTGSSMLYGYYFVMAIPIFGLVPLAAYRSLSSEIDNDTFELLSITQLASREIIRGKFASAVLQMMLYFAAVVPSLAFTYLLRGIGLAEISMVLIAVLMAGLFLSSFALMIAPMMTGFVGQSFAMVGLLAVIVFVQFIVAIICLAGIISSGVAATADAWMFTGLVSLMTLSFVVLFSKAAAAQIAPITENRSTSIRYWMLLQQAMWIIAIVSISFSYNDFEPINFGSMVLAGFWLLMGTVFLVESRELSPRVRRDLPSTFLTRVFLTALSPGPSSGYAFAVCSGSVAIFSLGLFGSLAASSNVTTDPILYSLTMVGYLAGYLGVVRLLTLPFARRSKLSLPLVLIVLAFVMIGAAFAPSVIHVAINGDLPSRYNDLEIINWAWTSVRGFESSGIPIHLAYISASVGGLITLINSFVLRDLYAYRKVAVPSRVTEDREAM
ncbi:ABC-2 family transporter protein [Rubripirellula obstinata]|uniref:ABC-2 family transporter protein n=1 Tax=Rubripirellula obstinata TaxID=406547 RepID=A0A5B1CJG3_9BACT|nr:hypothetical protein [Rubripirellula obstinata]KAA1259660.1 ABC-2 family transporter protein [Rubripirellula obstinata]